MKNSRRGNYIKSNSFQGHFKETSRPYCSSFFNMDKSEVIKRLKKMGNPKLTLDREKKFGVVATNALGITVKDLKELAREIKMNSSLALELFDSGIYEARILCSKLFYPKDLTPELMEKWVQTFDNWEICDSFCMTVFSRSPLALKKINEWSSREPEFEKRAAFATMAAYCLADKKAANPVFESFFPLILEAATDERLYVKKAVNWALRSIGKRNIDLNKEAIKLSERIILIHSKSAQWIAKDALKELKGENVRISDYPRSIYRPS